MERSRRTKLGSYAGYITDFWRFVRAHPYVAVVIVLGMILLGSGDFLQVIPGLSFLAAHPAFRVYHEVHDLMAITLAFYIAYRWLPMPGVSALFLFMLAHVPYIILFPHDLVEYVNMVIFGVVGVIASLLIAERRRAADLTLARELEVRAQFNASPIGISIVQDGKFRYVNPQLQLNTGYSQDELVGLDAEWFTHPDDRPTVREKLVKMLKGEFFSPCEFRTVTKSGAVRWVLGTVTSISYRGRRATLGNFLDITERRQAEQAAKDLALFAEMSPAPLLRFDRDSRIIFANSAARVILGENAGDGAWLASALPSLKDINPVQCIKDGMLINREAIAAGRCFQLVIQGIPEMGVGHVYASDITGRRQAEEQYTTIIRTAMDGFWQVDSSGNILDVNDAYCRLSGYSRDELLRMRIQDLEAWETPEQTAEHMRRIIETGRDWFETCHRTKDGGLLNVEVSVTSGGPENGRFFVFTHDISRRKRMEEELHSLARRLVDVQEQERRVISRELHDQVGQYITGLKLSLDMVKHMSGEKAESKLAEAKMILDELMAQVRSLSLQLHPSMLDDLGLLPALLWHFERYTSQTGVKVAFTHTKFEAPLPNGVSMAAYRIIQEALTNVARYAGVKEATVKMCAVKDRLQLEVKDCGVGFDFRKVISTGTTCGLTGMRERATAIGGEVVVESVPGFGTTVRADLPLIERR